MDKAQKRRVWFWGIGSLMLCLSLISIGLFAGDYPREEHINDEKVPMFSSDPSLVMETEADYRVIPDKYNTGAVGELIKVELGGIVEGIQLKADGSGTMNVLDFYYRNKTVSGVVMFENLDFSEYPLMLYHTDKIDNQITLVFNNCRFSTMSSGMPAGQISCEFNNCTFNCFTGSNATLFRCRFGDYYKDCIVPYQNVYVQDCFFRNMSVMKNDTGEIHSDGTHLYGHADVPLFNVSYDNCRFEIPSIKLTGSNASVNSCFMLQLEYNDASDISVNNCIMNGGGYSIYAWAKKSQFTMENVVLRNIKVGCVKELGIFYPRISSDVVIDNVIETDSLYVASVWKEDGQTHFSVTNDTNQERKLEIFTDMGRFTYTIPACPRGEDLHVNSHYDDLPFDIDIIVPEDCGYAVCYDVSVSRAAKQIRFVDWTGETVYLTTEEVEELFSGRYDVWYSGQCGKDVWYELNKSGDLTISGSGATYNFHSKKRAPWYEYRELVKRVIVEEGVTCLGEQLFKDCASIQSVVLPDGLVEIKQRSFEGCIALKTINWPSTLQSVGKKAFSYDFMDLIQYEGTDIHEIVTDTENIESIMRILECSTVLIDTILSGECGADCYYSLDSDGTLYIYGTGKMNNYHSMKTAPWFEYREDIYTVVIEEGITKIGNQAFRKCNNLSEVVLCDGLISIGTNAFINCSSLLSIWLPQSIIEIQAWAFASSGILDTYYAGTMEQWHNIQIGKNNEPIFTNVICEE